MDIDLSWMLDPKTLIGGVWAVILVVAGGVLVVVRGRMRVLQYVAQHTAVGLSNSDDAFGKVEVRLSGALIERLWLTTVTLTNETGKDFEALPVRIYTNDDSVMFGERTEVSGSTFKIHHSPEFTQSLQHAPGAAPTLEQQNLFGHRRDYIVPVLNRGESAKWHILTTVKPVPSGQTPIQGPSVWCDMLKAGVKVRYRMLGPQVLGVPTKYAVGIGFFATAATYAVAVLVGGEPWMVALPSTIVGFSAAIVGAWIYKALRLILPLVVH